MKKRNAIIFGSILLVLIIGIIVFIISYYHSYSIKTYNGEEVSFEYDGFWNLKDKNNVIRLTRKTFSKAEITISKSTIPASTKTEDKQMLVDGIMYQMLNNIKDYTLKNSQVKKEKDVEYFEYLYENDGIQIAFYFYVSDSNYYVITYQNTKKEFDLLYSNVDVILSTIKFKG